MDRTDEATIGQLDTALPAGADPPHPLGQDPAAHGLPGPARWLGARDGYSHADLTSLQIAYQAEEVAQPDPDRDFNEVLELRIHGVGGASAESNLETPTTLLVAGDHKAGFYRAWFPGQKGARTALREAYCWGKFSYATLTSAAWLLLLPFALVNLASWALPSPHRENQKTDQSDGRCERRISRVLLRLLGLVFTVAFFTTLCFLLADIVARQAVSDGKLPGWLAWFKNRSDAHRETLALAVAFAALIALRIFGRYTTGKYESWSPGTHLTDMPDVRLSAKGMWAGSLSVRRQQVCHILAAGAVILTFTGSAFGPNSTQLHVAEVVATLMVVFAAAVLATPGCDRLSVDVRQWALPEGIQNRIEIATWVGVFAALIYLWIADPVAENIRGYDLEDKLLHGSVIAELVFLVALVVVLYLQKPNKQVDVFARGYLSVILAGLAVAISTIFGGALLLTVTNLLSTPTLRQQVNEDNIFVPGIVASGNVAFLATLAATLCVGAHLFRWRSAKKEALSEVVPADHQPESSTWLRDTPVVHEYRTGYLPPTDGPDYEKSRKKVAGIWATSRMTDRAGVVGAGLVIPTLIVLSGVEAIQIARAILDEETSLSKMEQPKALLVAAQFGSLMTVAATIAFITFLRGAMVSEGQRRKFAFFWDVVNFWPRAAHPFAPPCYAERVVPEVTTRIRRVTGDRKRSNPGDAITDPAVAQVASEQDLDPSPKNLDQGFEPNRPIVLNGYSQGSPISIAVIAQLPGKSPDRVALLTLACPAHRLYGRAFPLYFGPDQLQLLLYDKLTHLICDEEAQTHTPVFRWINMCRRSDYVGGPIGMGLDRWILDPPALWPAGNPSPPPAHLHSDWFPDPKTHLPVEELAKMLPPFERPSDLPTRPATARAADAMD